ncbi:MAG: glycosyl transferase family 2 [Proteobacteria bacterium]|nr:glycosyl transferase family 2 [Pseudomonadota bacterium]
MALSVMIPIATGDKAWPDLLADLSVLTPQDEIIFVSTEAISDQVQNSPAYAALPCSCQFEVSAPGRAKQLNAGARRASHDNLWFLHCDSRVPESSIEALLIALHDAPEALHFFDLKFQNDGPFMVHINGVGVWMRSRMLRLPFGDQGFCTSRATFDALGGFDESTPYGEDHLLVWRAHQAGIRVRAVGARLYTSARKYRTYGWRHTTARHLRLTAKQALPEFVRLLRERIFI